MDEVKKKFDIKQMGIGGASAVGLLFMFQNQGIDLMNKNQDASNKIVIERTIANAQRIQKLESTVENLNHKLDSGFNSVRNQIRDDTNRLSEIMRIASGDRYTKSEQLHYADSVSKRLDRLEDDVKELTRTIKNK